MAMLSQKPENREDKRLLKEQVGRLSRLLLKYSQPKFQLFLILLLTASVGAGTSFVLLKCGLNVMGIRYPIAAVIAYLTFLTLLRLWVQYKFSNLDLVPEAGIPEPKPESKTKRSAWNLNPFDFDSIEGFTKLHGIASHT